MQLSRRQFLFALAAAATSIATAPAGANAAGDFKVESFVFSTADGATYDLVINGRSLQYIAAARLELGKVSIEIIIEPMRATFQNRVRLTGGMDGGELFEREGELVLADATGAEQRIGVRVIWTPGGEIAGHYRIN
jgi:hypothetical protein